MAKYTKKWQKEFGKRYSAAIAELDSLEKEYNEMVASNPNEWVSAYPDNSVIEFGQIQSFYVYHIKEGEYEENPQERINISMNTKLGSFGFDISSLKEAVEFRTSLLESIDKLKRPEEKVKLIIDADSDCDDDEDAEETEWEIKAEQPLTQSWTYTVTAKSACEAIKKIENDEDGVINNDDNEYYDYGEIEYEAI